MIDETVNMTEEKVGYALVKARLLTDNQLRASMDYQRSLGGTLLEVVTKLGFVSQDAISRFVEDIQDPPAAQPAAKRPQAEKSERKPVPREAGELKDIQKKVSSPQRPPQRESLSGRRDSDKILRALIQLLVQKGTIQREELEEMLQSIH
jgi:hypothetical protein